MGLFSTKNHDGASGHAEPHSTISKKEMDRLAAQAARHNRSKAETFSNEGSRYSKAHRRDKAGEN